jgi:hypothetical protein
MNRQLESIMKKITPLALASLVLLAGCASAPMRGPMGSMAGPGPMQMDKQMHAMHQMHGKFAAAKTPAEQQALMNEQMEMMREGMDMMSRMHPAPGQEPGHDHAGVEKRMQMMQSMMQMMMDRMEATPMR